MKNQWQSIYDEVYKYVLPHRQQNTEDKTNKELFTSIGENSAIIFVNRMQQLLTPFNNDFLASSPYLIIFAIYLPTFLLFKL